MRGHEITRQRAGMRLLEGCTRRLSVSEKRPGRRKKSDDFDLG
jgi:hypothetical protein